MALIIDVAMGKVAYSKGSNGGLNLGNAIKSITGQAEGIVDLYQKVLESISGESYFCPEMFGIVRAIAPNTKTPEFVEIDVTGKNNVKLGSVGLHLLTLDFSEKVVVAKRSLSDYNHLNSSGELLTHVFANLAIYGKFPALAQNVNASIGDLNQAKLALLALDTAVDNAALTGMKESTVYFVQFGAFTYTDKDGEPIKRINTYVSQDGKEVKELVPKQLWIGGKSIVWASENKESLEKVILSRFVGTSTIEGFTQPVSPASPAEPVSPASPAEPVSPVSPAEPIVIERPDAEIEFLLGEYGSTFKIGDDCYLVDIIEYVESYAKSRITEVMKIREKQERENQLTAVKSAKSAIINWAESVIANA